MKSIVRRDNQEGYTEYLKRLAQAEGVQISSYDLHISCRFTASVTLHILSHRCLQSFSSLFLSKSSGRQGRYGSREDAAT